MTNIDKLLTTPFDEKIIRMYLAEAAVVVVDTIGETAVTLIEGEV